MPLINKIPSMPRLEDLGIQHEITKVKALPLVYWPNESLHIKCEDVTSFDLELNQLIMNMIYTMRLKDGVGLAAPQIGVNKNIIIVEEKQDYSSPNILINPYISFKSQSKIKMAEGCLSVPGYFEQRFRSASVMVEYFTPNKLKIMKTFTQLGAFVLQHEIDHLNGNVFIDNISDFKKKRILNKIKKKIK